MRSINRDTPPRIITPEEAAATASGGTATQTPSQKATTPSAPAPAITSAKEGKVLAFRAIPGGKSTLTSQTLTTQTPAPPFDLDPVPEAGGPHVGTPAKRCSRCGTVRPLTQFGKHEDSADGHQSYCNVCKNALNAKKRKNDICFRLKHHIASRVLKQFGNGAPPNTTRDLEVYLGYTMWQLRAALEEDLKTREGISLKDAFARNYHLDHIRPLSSFNVSGPGVEFQSCWAISNLRMISASENLQKGSKYNG